MSNHHSLPTGLPRLPPRGRLSCSRLRARRVSGPSSKWLLHGSTIGPDALRTAPCPRTGCPLQVHQAQLASGFGYNFCSALVESRIRQHRCAQPYGTTSRSGNAAAQRHFGLHPWNDLRWSGTTVRACISSSTLLVASACLRCYQSNPPDRCRASPSIAGGGGVRLPGGCPSGSVPHST